MHFNEGRMSRQLEMKFGVLENAVNQLINICSALAIEHNRLKKHVIQMSQNRAPGEGTKTEQTEDNFELDISQVQKILKQQNGPAGSAPVSVGRRVINN